MKVLLTIAIATLATTGSHAQNLPDSVRHIRDSVIKSQRQVNGATVPVQQNTNQPISSQPENLAPVPPPLTNPTHNPSSNQTNQPVHQNQMVVPAPRQPVPARNQKQKRVEPFRAKPKPAQLDTLPGTQRNG
jgi:hypothetical protein